MLSNLSSKPTRDRAVLLIVPLLVFQLLLLSVQIQNPTGMMTPIKTLILAIQAPFINISSGVKVRINSVWEHYFWLKDARVENEQLIEQVQQLKRQNRSYEEIRKENIRLRRLLSMKDVIEYKSVGAHVIARTPGFLSNVLYINRGIQDGVRIDFPVFSGDGIIGRIVLVTGNQSQVQLITNPDASTGVMMERTRTPGVLSGSGDSMLDLNYISDAEQIDTGDIVLSSGLDGIFPKGYLIGKVVDARKSKGVFYIIKVEPAVDLYHVEEVSVLIMDS